MTTRFKSSAPGLVIVFLLLVVVVCAVRAPSFCWSVVNWDESIYLLISRDMLDGDVLYTGVWDRKQPLTFVIFALTQIVFGRTILAIRLLACIAVATTCFGLYLIARRNFDDSWIGAVAAAGLYALYSISSGGLATNTEILFAPLTVFAVALVLPWWISQSPETEPSIGISLGAGLLLGLATLTKLIAVFDATFVSLLLVAGWFTINRSERHRRPVNWLVRRAAAMTLGLSIPWIASAVCFFLTGAFDDFVFANFTFNRMNLADRPPFSLLNILLVMERLVLSENGLLWIGLGIGIVVLIVGRRSQPARDRRLLGALVVWALIGTAAAISLRRLYLHYYLQPTPALALIGGFLFARFWTLGKRISPLLKIAIALVLLIPQGVRIAERWRQIGPMVDVPAVVAAYVGNRIESGDTIYVANYQPILYYITHTRSPTRWAFPQFLISPVFRQRLDIDLEAEMASIFSHTPRFVVFNTRERDLIDPDYHRILFERYLDVDYTLDTQIMNIAIFRRSSGTPHPAPSRSPDSNGGGDAPGRARAGDQRSSVRMTLNTMTESKRATGSYRPSR